VGQAVAADESLVKGISLDDLKEPFGRPKRADLVCRRLRETVDVVFQPMAKCVAEIAEQYREDVS
jgi:hypothetical protein